MFAEANILPTAFSTVIGTIVCVFTKLSRHIYSLVNSWFASLMMAKTILAVVVIV